MFMFFDSVASHFGFERLYDGRSAASTIDQNQSQAPWWMGQSVASQNIRTRTFAQSNDIFNVQEIQNSDQIFAQCLQRWERKASHHSKKSKQKEKTNNQSSIRLSYYCFTWNEYLPFRKCLSIVSMSGYIDVNETRSLLDFSHAWRVHEFLERWIYTCTPTRRTEMRK